MVRVKKTDLKRKFAAHSYRKALPYLLKDFGERCAYSQRHIKIAGGMEVDHFDPTLKNSARHTYKNLLPAIRHCNGKKSDHWPSPELAAKGISLINPCEDVDYGKHIFEDPISHELVGATPKGKYHITICDLNAPFLVEERKIRSKLRYLFDNGDWNYKKGFSVPEMSLVLNMLDNVKEHIDRLIPPIPAPPITT